MKSTELPCFRTLHFAHPADVQRRQGDGFTLYDTPECRGSYFGHRIVIEEPPEPDDIERFADAWYAEHGDKGLETAWLCWESRKPWAHEPPAGAKLYTNRTLMADTEITRVEDWAGDIRPLSGPDDIERVVELFAAGLKDDETAPPDVHRWYWRGLDARVQDEWGVWLGDFDGDTLRGVAACMFDTREARMQGIVTHPKHRRLGVCTALVRAAVQQYQEISFGITFILAQADSDAERLYRNIGFRGVTWVYELGLPGQRQTSP